MALLQLVGPVADVSLLYCHTVPTPELMTMTLVMAVADVTARVSSWVPDPRRSSLCHL